MCRCEVHIVNHIANALAPNAELFRCGIWLFTEEASDYQISESHRQCAVVGLEVLG